MWEWDKQRPGVMFSYLLRLIWFRDGSFHTLVGSGMGPREGGRRLFSSFVRLGAESGAELAQCGGPRLGPHSLQGNQDTERSYELPAWASPEYDEQPICFVWQVLILDTVTCFIMSFVSVWMHFDHNWGPLLTLDRKNILAISVIFILSMMDHHFTHQDGPGV